MEQRRGEFTLSDDPACQQVARCHALLCGTYWAADRTLEQVKQAMTGSLVMGLFRGGVQIGLARAVTDGSCYAWVCDVVVAEEFRGHGLGKWMLDTLLGHPLVAPTRTILVTKDAQQFYVKYGFRTHPFECMMRTPEVM